jgi:hypothetical protein
MHLRFARGELAIWPPRSTFQGFGGVLERGHPAALLHVELDLPARPGTDPSAERDGTLAEIFERYGVDPATVAPASG